MQKKFKAGNENMSDAVDIHTILNLPPTFTKQATASNITRTSMNISATAKDSDGDTLTYTILRGTSSSNITTSRGTTSSSSGSTVSFTDTGLSSNTTYYYKIKVTDGYGGEATSTSYGSQRTYCLGSYCSGGYYTHEYCAYVHFPKQIM